jgi:hypothetical protein
MNEGDSESSFDKVKKGFEKIIGGSAEVVEGTAQGIKKAVEDKKEGVEDTYSYEERKNKKYNEVGQELEDAGDNVTAGTKAVLNKVEDPEKELDIEYQKEKTEEELD